MDERLEEAKKTAHLHATVFVQKQNLKLRIKNMLTHSTNGGLFRVDATLINLVDFLIRRGETDAVLLDSKDNPIKIVNLDGFLDDIMGIYFEVLNDYHAEFQKLRRRRTVSDLVGL